MKQSRTENSPQPHAQLSPVHTVALTTAHNDQVGQHDITKALADTLNDALSDEVARAKAVEAALDTRVSALEVSIGHSEMAFQLFVIGAHRVKCLHMHEHTTALLPLRTLDYRPFRQTSVAAVSAAASITAGGLQTETARAQTQETKLSNALNTVTVS